MKSGNLNFLETSGPLQACNGTASLRHHFKPQQFDTILLNRWTLLLRGPGDRSLATRYGLDGPGIEFQWRQDISHPSRTAIGPPSFLQNGHRVSFLEVKRPERGVDHSPPSSAEIKESVQLYLCSPSGPSWPVTFTFYSPATGGYELSHAVTSCFGTESNVTVFRTLWPDDEKRENSDSPVFRICHVTEVSCLISATVGTVICQATKKAFLLPVVSQTILRNAQWLKLILKFPGNKTPSKTHTGKSGRVGMLASQLAPNLWFITFIKTKFWFTQT